MSKEDTGSIQLIACNDGVSRPHTLDSIARSYTRCLPSAVNGMKVVRIHCGLPFSSTSNDVELASVPVCW